jgi:hypothetical protein
MSLTSPTRTSRSRPARVKQCSSTTGNDMFALNANTLSFKSIETETETCTGSSKSTTTEINETRAIAHKLHRVRRRLLLELAADNKAKAATMSPQVSLISAILLDRPKVETVPLRVMIPTVLLDTTEPSLSKKLSVFPNVALDLGSAAFFIKRAQAA